MSNFGFLRAEWPDLYAEAAQAERAGVADPRTSCFYARRCLELTVQWLYQADGTLVEPYSRDLAPRIAEPTLTRLVGSAVRNKMDFIRLEGNRAVHRKPVVKEKTSMRVLGELFHILYWVARHYTRNAPNLPASGLAFDPNLVPRPEPAEVKLKKQAELQALAEKYAKQDAELAAARAKHANLDAEIARLRAVVAEAKKANATRPDTHDYNEADTRTLLIDMLLSEAGWWLDRPDDREYPVSGLPTPSGDGRVDYVLWDDDGKPLALVEAKRTSVDPISGRQQAKAYADALEAKFGQRPVIFCTNGYHTEIWDDLNYPPRDVQGFYTKDELRLLIQRRVSRRSPAGLPINEAIASRNYQSRAIRRIVEEFDDKRARRALLVMATGAGKTRTTIALVDLLARANWVRRVLFLADRRTLVRQATNAFKEHVPGIPTVNLLTDSDTTGRVFVSTYPTMLGLINEMGESGRRFGPGYFDLIIVDEAHRSIYKKYGALFDYFDALLVGLTATPKDEIDRNTYRIFDLEDGVPTDNYSLDEAVSEHYLVPPRAVDVPLKFQREGIRYADLSEDEKEKWDELEWDIDGTVPEEVNPEELNKYLFNADTVDKALKVLMTRGKRVAGGDRLGKTIIFARNTAHANFIARRFDANFPEYHGEFAQVITHQTANAEHLIDQFARRDTAPHIAISVDMLDTGVDVPEVVNLVFYKPVRSKTKFWQMIGRGTRLCPDLFGENVDKDAFLVFDLYQNIEFFNQDLPHAEGTVAQSLSERLFRHRADLLLALDTERPELGGTMAPEGSGTVSETGVRWDVARRLHHDVTDMNLDNVLVRPYREQVEKYSDLANWRHVTPERHTEITDGLAGLPTAYRDDDNSEEAKRFDLLALRLQLCLLQIDSGYEGLRQQIQEIASALLDQVTIPVIRAQQQLLDDLTGDEWWQDVTLPMLESMRRRIRKLVKLIDKTRRGVVYTDFADRMGDLSLAELRDVPLGTDRSRFEAKVRTYLRTHENELAVQKLRRNRQITAADLAQLEQTFLSAGFGTEADIDQAQQEKGGLGLFLRSLTGLDRAAASAAFDQFQAGRTLTATELDFLNLLIDYLASNGTIDIDALYEPPFTSLAPQGPDVVFPSADLDIIVDVIDSFRHNAVPAEEAS